MGFFFLPEKQQNQKWNSVQDAVKDGVLFRSAAT